MWSDPRYRKASHTGKWGVIFEGKEREIYCGVTERILFQDMIISFGSMNMIFLFNKNSHEASIFYLVAENTIPKQKTPELKKKLN